MSAPTFGCFSAFETLLLHAEDNHPRDWARLIAESEEFERVEGAKGRLEDTQAEQPELVAGESGVAEKDQPHIEGMIQGREGERGDGVVENFEPAVTTPQRPRIEDLLPPIEFKRELSSTSSH